MLDKVCLCFRKGTGAADETSQPCKKCRWTRNLLILVVVGVMAVAGIAACVAVALHPQMPLVMSLAARDTYFYDHEGVDFSELT